MSTRIALLQGTLDLLILRILIFGRQHGQGIARAIQEQSGDELLVDHGSLYPALQRLEDRGWIGYQRQQSQGALLQTHPRRRQTTRARDQRLAAYDRGHAACSGFKGLTMSIHRPLSDFSAEIEAHIALEADRLRREEGL